jgi:hypothetical protein
MFVNFLWLRLNNHIPFAGDFTDNTYPTGLIMTSQPSTHLQLRRTMFVSTLLLFIVAQGCAKNLEAIQDFADLSAESAGYTRLVEEYVESPHRQKRYQPAGRHAGLETMARERAGQRQALLLRQTLVERYMNALGHLAADEVVDKTEELAHLTTALRDHAGTDLQEKEAFEKMAGLLTNAAGNRWRQRQLDDLIEQSNPSLQRILDALQRIVSDGFGGDLQTEEAALNKYYSALIMESQDPAGKAALAEWKEFRTAQVQERAQAVQTYRTLLEKISEGHQQLFDRRHDLDKQHVLQHVKHSVKDLRTLLDTIKQL